MLLICMCVISLLYIYIYIVKMFIVIVVKMKLIHEIVCLKNKKKLKLNKQNNRKVIKKLNS